MATKAVLKQKAAALKRKLARSAAVQEQLRLDHEEAAREAEALEAALEHDFSDAPPNLEMGVSPSRPVEPWPSVELPPVKEPVVLHRSMWQRFLDSF